MLISVIPIGNSKGIRLPKAIIEQLQITDKLDLEVENQRIILRPLTQRPRQGWREAFTHMHDEQQDKLLLEDTNENEAFEWEW
uniref:AbrB/MazE/SpoVT family DNA-binding domain-containing protein n=1 Tax=Gracilinema caldarium TaxID=215591 RepID=A0A7C3EA58_9SPIR